MILSYGVVDNDGKFFELKGSRDKSNLTAKVVMIEDGGKMVFLPMSEFERFTVTMEYR